MNFKLAAKYNADKTASSQAESTGKVPYVLLTIA